MVRIVEKAQAMSSTTFSFPSLNNSRPKAIFSGKKILTSVSGRPLPGRYSKVDLELENRTFQRPVSDFGQVFGIFSVLVSLNENRSIFVLHPLVGFSLGPCEKKNSSYLCSTYFTRASS